MDVKEYIVSILCIRHWENMDCIELEKSQPPLFMFVETTGSGTSIKLLNRNVLIIESRGGRVIKRLNVRSIASRQRFWCRKHTPLPRESRATHKSTKLLFVKTARSSKRTTITQCTANPDNEIDMANLVLINFSYRRFPFFLFTLLFSLFFSCLFGFSSRF